MNTGDPPLGSFRAGRRVLEIQTKLHRWANDDPHRRFDDLFNLVTDPSLGALTDQFRALRRRRLVIIGAPGSGKTTLAVQLLLQLLADWQPGEPVPVLFSLASWEPSRQPRVQDWLADQMAQSYPHLRAFGAGVAQKLADQGRLLPVLDGLDEVVPEPAVR